MWKRLWFRWTVRCVAFLLLALFSMTFYYRLRGVNELAEARMEFTKKVGPLDPKAYEPKPVKEEDNGAVWLLAGGRAVVVFPDERQNLHALLDNSPSHWTKEQVEFAQRVLDRNAPALTLLHRSQGSKACNLSAVTSGGEEKYLLALLGAARLLATDGRDAVRQGDMGRFFASAESLRTLAAAQDDEPELIDALMGGYAERLLLALIREAASVCSPDTALAGRFNALLPSADLAKAWLRSVGYENAKMLDRMASGRDENEDGTKLGWFGKLRQWTFLDIDLAYILRMRISDVEWASKPLGLRGDPPPTPPRPILLPISGMWSAAEVFRGEARFYASGRIQATSALRQMTAIGLKVRKTGIDTGAYPTDLSALPEAKMPDPFTGKPVIYTLNADGSATLTVLNAEVLYKKVTQGKGPLVTFSWTLPPLSPVPPAPARTHAQPI